MVRVRINLKALKGRGDSTRELKTGVAHDRGRLQVEDEVKGYGADVEANLKQ